MAGYRDWEMLNQSITGLGEGFARRNQQGVINDREAARLAMERDRTGVLKDREDRFEKEGNRRFDLMMDREDRMRETAMKPTYRWKSGKVEHTAHSLRDFGQMIQEFPADATEDDHSELDLSGVNAHGVTVRQKIRIPNTLEDRDGAKQSAAQAIKAFAEYTGSVNAPDPVVTTTPGGQEIITRGKQMLKGAGPAAQGSTTTEIRETPPSPFAVPGTPATKTTNVTTRVPNVPLGTSGGQPSGKRVRVQGPNGQKGTVEAGDKLPEGWSIIE